MKLSAREIFGVCLLVAGVLLLGAEVWAQQAAKATSDGEVSFFLANSLYCDARALISGNVGVILGLLLVVMGLWSLVQGGGWFGAILAMVLGAAIPSLPGLVESFMSGLGKLLIEAELSSSNRTFRPPTCPVPAGALKAFEQGTAILNDSTATP